MKKSYAIIDLETKTVLKIFDNEDAAKRKCHIMRRDKYAKHDVIKEIQYDRCPFDNNLNVIEFKTIF